MDPGSNGPLSTETTQNPRPNSVSGGGLLLGLLLLIAALVVLSVLL
ncbi:hypothetical protein [Halosimplex amylolyticum]